MASRTRLYIGNISHTTEQKVLEEIFLPFGKIRDFSRKDKFAFVEFFEPSVASQVVSKANDDAQGLEYFGVKLRVEFAKERSNPLPPAGGNQRGRCFRCGEAGHMARECGRRSRSRSRSPRRRYRSRSRSYSPPRRRHYRSRSRSYSPPRRRRRSYSRSRSPVRRSYSRSPVRRAYSPARRYSRSPARRSYSRSPVRRSYSRSPVKRSSRSRERVRRSSRSRSRSPSPRRREERSTRHSMSRSPSPRRSRSRSADRNGKSSNHDDRPKDHPVEHSNGHVSNDHPVDSINH